LLLTFADTEDRRRYLNARATLRTLIELGCVPVINENDSVATAEIRFGDNDRLAARVAEMLQADQLVLFSDIDGLYTADPRRDSSAAHIPVVESITPRIEAAAGDPPPGFSSGGMRTKLAAARVATQAGCAMAIAVGHCEHPLRALVEGARCTWFLPLPEAAAPANAGSPAACSPPAASPSMPAPPQPLPLAAPCCPPASATSPAISPAATPSSFWVRTAPALARASQTTTASTRPSLPDIVPRKSSPSSAGAAATN